MSIHTDKKSGRLYIEFQYKKARYKERLPKGTTRKDAERIEIRVKNQMMFQSHGIETRKAITFDLFIREYFGPYAEAHYPPDRYDRLVILLKALVPFVKGKPLRSIKAADIERFKSARMNLLTIHKTIRKPATIEREMSVISSIFTMAVKNDLIEYNPCSRVTKLSFDNTQDKVLRREDEAKFFKHIATDWAHDVCKMVLNTGLRQNDLMRLTRFQVRFDENRIILTQGKTKRQVIVMLNPVSRAILESRWHNGRDFLFASPVTGTEKGSVRHTMLRACEKAEIEPLTIRDLRRTWYTRLLEGDTDVVTASRMAGHSNTRMSSRYGRSVDLMQKAADNLVEPVKLKAVK